jgi:hypothetical protein
VHGAVVTLIAAEGSLTPLAVAERTRTSHVPAGTRVATNDGTSVRATGANAGLPFAAASTTNPDGAGEVEAGVHDSATRSSATDAIRPDGGSGVPAAPMLNVRRVDAALRPAPLAATSSTS